MTQISQDLLLAILSLDAYNRGYGAGVGGLAEESDGSAKVGATTVSYNIEDANLSAEAQAAGFYAIAYELTEAVGDLAAGSTVISYRDTDDFFPDDLASDVFRGWVTGAGIWKTDQVRLSQEFYDAVRGNPDDPSNVILTGHSLGRALFNLYLQTFKTVIFINKPSRAAAVVVSINDNWQCERQAA